MAKFCGNCGSQLDDTAKICGYCGKPLDTNDADKTQIPGIEYGDPEKKAKTKKMVKLGIGIAALVVLAIIVFNIVSSFVGYKGAVRKIMNAYEDYDVETIVDMASEVYFCMGYSDAAEYYFESAISSDLDIFEDRVGHDYDISYDIIDAYDMSEHRLDRLLDSLSHYNEFDPDIITEVKVVELEVVAEEGRDETTLLVELTLTKEDGEWKLLYLE